jgi:hypothetical protein
VALSVMWCVGGVWVALCGGLVVLCGVWVVALVVL